MRLPILPHRHWWDFIQPLIDSASILAALVAVRWGAHRRIDDGSLAMGLIAVIVFLLSGHLTGLYRKSHAGSPNTEISGIIGSWMMTLLVLALLGYATRTGQDFARSVMLAWAVLAPTVVGLGRMSLRIVQQGLMLRGIGTRRIAIAGLNELGIQVTKNVAEDPSLGFKMLGFYDDRDEMRSASWDVTSSPLQGNLSELVALARNGGVDTVFITLPMRAEHRIRFLLDQLSDSTASVYIVPDFFVFELLHSRWTSMGGIPAVSVFENPLFGVDGVLKRMTDVVLAVAGIVVAAIPMCAIALAVKLSSPGPVFFRQKRYGLDGKEILVWKFRSMQACDNGPVVKQATKGDPRVTRVGNILRRTSLDELPQLFNVISGSMSLVGPRPHASAHNEQYRSRIRGYMLRHKVKPGITGLAQVNGCRGETDTIEKMEQRVDWDHRYIRSWSLWLDIKILIKTLRVAWSQPEAY